MRGRSGETGGWCRVWVRGHLGQIRVLEGSLWQEMRDPGLGGVAWRW